MDRAYDLSRDQWRVRDVMSGEVVTTTPEASMGEAARVMGERRIGSLIVLVDGEPGGIVTERDLLTRVLGAGLRPGEVKVRSVMSRPLISVSP
ncbi:MAG TPA: CBS domain-containing protein, partial [Candidatus Bathyarchaeia archaeon]